MNSQVQDGVDEVGEWCKVTVWKDAFPEMSGVQKLDDESVEEFMIEKLVGNKVEVDMDEDKKEYGKKKDNDQEENIKKYTAISVKVGQ